MNFNDLIGQKKVINNLKNSIKNSRISHAYIFEGPEGIGKRSMASIFATALTCYKQGQEPCNLCKSCVQNRTGNHPDVQIIKASGKSIGIEQIREIQNEIHIKPYATDKKIYIIHEADKMTVQAQNGLLKILEEPPAYAVIILTIVNASMLLGTILSRGVLIRFQLHPQHEIEEYLQKSHPEIKQEFPFISMFSEGVIGKAKDMAQSQEIRELRHQAMEIIISLINESEIKTLDTISYFKEHRENIYVLLDFMLLWFRDVLFIKELNSNEQVINIDMLDKLEDFAKKISSYALYKIIDCILETMKKINMNSNFNLAIEAMLIQCWEEIHGRRSRSAI